MATASSFLRYLSAGLAALFGLASSPAVQAQSLSPEAAPAIWVAYAEAATVAVAGWLEADDEAASRLRRGLFGAEMSADPSTASLELKLWIAPDGLVSRLGFEPLGDEQAEADLRATVAGRRLPPPPGDMLQPLRLAVQLEPAPADQP